MFTVSYLKVLATHFFIFLNFVNYEKILVFLFSCIGNHSYANSITALKTDVIFVEPIPFYYIEAIVIPEECFREFHMPCPPGTYGEGNFWRQYFDCSSGEGQGYATYGSGCENEDQLPVEP